MKSKAEIEDLRNMLGAMVEMGKDGPFKSEARNQLAAVQNALCYILEDGSEHARTFERNWSRILEWCDNADIQFLKIHKTKQ